MTPSASQNDDAIGGEAAGMRAGLRCLKGAVSPGPAPGRGAALTDGRSCRGGGGSRRHRALPGSSHRDWGVPALPGAEPALRGAGCGRVAGAGPAGVTPLPAWRGMGSALRGDPQFPGLGVVRGPPPPRGDSADEAPLGLA